MRLPPVPGARLVPRLAGFAANRHPEQLLGVLRAVHRVLLEAGEDELVELTRDPELGSLRRRHRLRVHVLHQHLHRRVRLEDQVAGQEEIRHAAKGVHVGPAIDVSLPDDDFRRHVRRRPGGGVVHRHERFEAADPLPHLHETEIQHLDEVVLEPHPADVDVGRLDVAVHHAARVGVGQRMADLPQQEDGAVGRHRPELADQAFEVAPRQQFHHVIEGAIARRPEVEHLDGVRRTERRGSLGFALEAPLHDTRVRLVTRAHDFGPHQLDRRVTGQQLVPRAPDFTHAAAPEQLDELVVPECLRLAQPTAEPVQHLRRQHRDHGA